jgi:Zn-dependent protease with chaperone function
MGLGRPPRGLLCHGCGTILEPLEAAEALGVHRLVCPSCGEIFRARRRRREAGPAGPSAPALALSSSAEPAPVGALGLVLRGWGLRGLERAFHTGMVAGTLTLLALGGFSRVFRGWLNDEVNGWGRVVETLGGVHVVAETQDPDADLGPAIVYADAPALFAAISEVARRLGAKPPMQVRLSYLPCCGVVAWKRSNALVLGLPLLHVLTMAELRAVLAHELAHLARGDATRSARSARFVRALGQALDQSNGRVHGPLGAWARACHRLGEALLAPIARGQEARADRCAAAIAGGDAAASALVKVALVQPLFREVLEQYNPTNPDLPNLYAFFRAFWHRLPEPLFTNIRLHVLSGLGAIPDGVHPPLPDRLAIVQSYPRRDPADSTPAKTTLGDLEALEQMLHNRLYSTPGVEPSIFHRAGT